MTIARPAWMSAHPIQQPPSAFESRTLCAVKSRRSSVASRGAPLAPVRNFSGLVSFSCSVSAWYNMGHDRTRACMTPATIRAEIRELARSFYERRKAAHTTPPEWRDVSPAQFPHLDVSFYDRVSSELIVEGFRWLGDKENVALSRLLPDLQTFVRGFVGDDGSTSASVWHVRPLGRARVASMIRNDRNEVRAVALSTEFEGRTFVLTSNVKGHDGGHDVPGIESQRLGQQAPASSLLKVHRIAVAQRISAGGIVVRARDAEDLLAGGLRMHELTAAHLARVGYFNEALETARWRDRLSPDSLRLLLAELRALHEADIGGR